VSLAQPPPRPGLGTYSFGFVDVLITTSWVAHQRVVDPEMCHPPFFRASSNC
jgi:hypothetical protein